MKKILLISAAVLTLGLGAYSVYAEGADFIQEDVHEYNQDYQRVNHEDPDAYMEIQTLNSEERDIRFNESDGEGRKQLEDERYYEENGRYRHRHHDVRSSNGDKHRAYSRQSNRNHHRNGYCH